IIKENGSNGSTKMTVIEREEILGPSPELNYKRSSSQERVQNGHKSPEERVSLEFNLSHCLDLVKAGMESIIEDQRKSALFLTHISSPDTRPGALIGASVWVGQIWWLLTTTAAVGLLPSGGVKQRTNRCASLVCFNFLSRCISAVISYHDAHNRPRGGICVANHTSPIDVLVLMCDNGYSLIGQRHGGFLGLLQRALARASPHIWFERSEAKDRHAVAKRLKEHISVPGNPPILIFPEGTCINNTSVMQFKKGSFEVGGTIYPVAIKYDPRFGDAFWNSSRYGMLHYLLNMMTSWAIVCDVWYLPPMHRHTHETAVDFANRVKAVVARRGGLVDLQWDGQLKRMKAKKEWRELQQEEFSKRLKGE
ncbi:hypothetical protein evm_013967, partial [Chilo suppressalis]